MDASQVSLPRGDGDDDRYRPALSGSCGSLGPGGSRCLVGLLCGVHGDVTLLLLRWNPSPVPNPRAGRISGRLYVHWAEHPPHESKTSVDLCKLKDSSVS